MNKGAICFVNGVNDNFNFVISKLTNRVNLDMKNPTDSGN